MLMSTPLAAQPSPTILVVDDDPDITLVLQDLLEHAGYRVQVAGTGAEALTKVKAESISAVLLDLMLPDMDGLSVLALLKEHDPLLPVIMLTAFVEVAKKHASLTEGAFGYLTKPYDGEEVKALIKRAVGVKHLSLEAASARQALTASEERFREVVQTAPDAIVLANGEGAILSWNSAAERLFGYPAVEILGQSLTRIMPERYRADHEREFPIEMSLSSWMSGGQRVHCGIVRDITARKEAEARLLQQQIEQQVLLDLIPAMVWYKDSHNRILRANRRAAESLHKTVAEIEGRHTDEFYPEEAERYHQDDLEVIVSGRAKLGIVEPYQTGSGEKRWVQTDKVPYLDTKGNVIGVLVFAQDITERTRQEAACREREELLRLVMAASVNSLLVADAEGKIVCANAAAEQQFGYETDELRGRLLAQVFVDPPRDQGLGTEMSADQRVGRRKDGTAFPAGVEVRRLETAKGVHLVVAVTPADGAA
jgi:PAS domain S-box-containing protein